MTRLRTRIHERPRGDASGFTLVEYTVAMTIFTVLIAITMSGVVMMTVAGTAVAGATGCAGRAEGSARLGLGRVGAFC